MGQRGSCCNLCQCSAYVFLSKSFIVPDLIFRSLIHFEFIFVYGVRKCSDFILLHVALQWGWYWKEVCVFAASMLTAGWKLASKGLWFSLSLANRCLLQCSAQSSLFNVRAMHLCSIRKAVQHSSSFVDKKYLPLAIHWSFLSNMWLTYLSSHCFDFSSKLILNLVCLS